MFYLTMHSTHFIYGYMERERNVLFNDALNRFYLRLYGVGHMVKDHSDSERGNPLPPHRLLFSINSMGSFICIIPQTGQPGLCYTSRGALAGTNIQHLALFMHIIHQNQNRNTHLLPGPTAECSRRSCPWRPVCAADTGSLPVGKTRRPFCYLQSLCADTELKQTNKQTNNLESTRTGSRHTNKQTNKQTVLSPTVLGVGIQTNKQTNKQTVLSPPVLGVGIQTNKQTNSLESNHAGSMHTNKQS